MKHAFNAFIVLLFIIGIIFFGFFLWQSKNKVTQQKLEEAYNNYIEADKEEKFGLKEEKLNKALLINSQLEREYNPKYSDGKLYYNLGNTFFQLGQYAWAELYYYKALALMPDNQQIKSNLELALKQLNIVPSENNTIFKEIFFLHYRVSLPVRLMVFFGLALMLFAFLSMHIWNPKNWLRQINIFLGCCLVILFISLMITQYFTPIEAVFVRAAALYKDAGENYSKVSDIPIAVGQKVEILDILEKGTWLKIRTSDGILGFVKGESIRII